MKPYFATLLALLLGATACTVHVDSQYGLRLAPPAVRNPKGHDDPASAQGSAPLLAHAEPSPAEAAEWPTEPWERPAAAAAAAPANDAVELMAPVHPTAAREPHTLTEPQSAAEAEIAAPTADLEAPEPPGATLPLWVETLLGILLALLAVGLVVLGGMASVLAVVSFGFGDVAFGWLLVLAAVAGFIGGYFVYRLARPMLPELHFYWLSNRYVRLVLGIVSLVFFLLTFGI
jgi:hypothetical protein